MVRVMPAPSITTVWTGMSATGGMAIAMTASRMTPPAVPVNTPTKAVANDATVRPTNNSGPTSGVPRKSIDGSLVWRGGSSENAAPAIFENTNGCQRRGHEAIAWEVRRLARRPHGHLRRRRKLLRPVARNGPGRQRIAEIRHLARPGPPHPVALGMLDAMLERLAQRRQAER